MVRHRASARLVSSSTPRVLLYGTGGLAVAGIKTNGVLSGFTAARVPTSVGLEQRHRRAAGRSAPASKARSPSNWTGKLEYLYMDLGSVYGQLDPVSAHRPADRLRMSTRTSTDHILSRRHQLPVRRPGGREVLISTQRCSRQSKPRHRPGLFCRRLQRNRALRLLRAANSRLKAVCAGSANRCNMRRLSFVTGDTMAAPIKFGVGQSVASQGRRRADSRQGPLHRRSRAAGLDACAGAALAACAREIHHQRHPRPRACRASVRS